MSIRVMAKVWEFSACAGTDLLALLAIADFADDEGNAYPAVRTLATKCRLGTRQMHYILANLQRCGELNVRIGGGPKGTNRYRISVPQQGVQHSAGVQSTAGVQHSAPPPALQCTKPLHHSAPKPSGTINNHQSKPAPSARALLSDISDELFSDFERIRKAKRAPITKTTVDGIRREAAKAGVSVEKAIRECCERGWQSFKADWVTGGKQVGNGASADGSSKPWEGAR